MVIVEKIPAERLDAARTTIQGLIAAARVDTADVCRLRSILGDAPGLSAAEVETLFELERVATAKCAEWVAFLVDCVTDYIVWQQRPTGVVTSAQAEWLLAQADACRSVGAFAALVNILAEAHRVPAWLPAAIRGRAAQWPDLAGALRATGVAAA